MEIKNIFGAAGIVGAGVVSLRKVYPWIGHDLMTAKRMQSIGKELESMVRRGMFLIEMFEKNASLFPKKAMIIYNDAEYTFEFMNEQANRVANVVKSWNVCLGDCVAMMCYNEPAFIWTFLGLQKLGIAVAFINCSVMREALRNSVVSSGAKYLVVGQGQELLDAVHEVKYELRMPVYVQGRSESLPVGYLPFDDEMERAYPAPISKARRKGMTMNTHMAYFYTSGTTGVSKAVIMRQSKAIGFLRYLKLAGVRSNDVIYNTLPLHHAAGGGVGLYTVLFSGCTMVLRNKFSASNFFADCRKHNVTVVQYIGEIFRYLLSQPESPLDKQHKIRVAAGNGLRKDIWESFQSRFNIPLIAEFFGATEGTGIYMNLTNKPGAVGRHSLLLRAADPNPKFLVKYDQETATPVRDSQGRCIQISPGECGLVLSAVPPDLIADGATFYKGRLEENEKKLVRNAFAEGDMYFNFGDVLYLDKDHFLFFHDRIGDTFRWKGENVSTTEVANCLASIESVEDANVYGVTVSGAEGKAGMAAVYITNGEEPVTESLLSVIHETCARKLPGYARPMFLRFPREMILTSTFKHSKVQYQQEAYDPSVVRDPLFYRDDQLKKFVPLTQQMYPSLMTKSKL